MTWDLEPSPSCHLTSVTSCAQDWVLCCLLSCTQASTSPHPPSITVVSHYQGPGDSGGGRGRCWKIRLGFVVAALTAQRQQHHRTFGGDSGSPEVILQTPGSGGHLVGAPAAVGPTYVHAKSQVGSWVPRRSALTQPHVQGSRTL